MPCNNVTKFLYLHCMERYKACQNLDQKSHGYLFCPKSAVLVRFDSVVIMQHFNYWTELLGARIESHLEGNLISNSDRTAAGHIKQLLIKIMAPVIKSIRNPPDNMEEYRQDYGYMGISFHSAVVKARNQPTPTTTAVATSVSASTITTVGQAVARQSLTSNTPIVQQVSLMANAACPGEVWT